MTISGKVNGILVTFLVDTGATLLNFEVPQISNETVMVQGVVGEEIKYLSTPLPVVLNGKLVWGRFVISPNSPVSLLGRDLLQEFGTFISLAPTGIKLIIMGSEVIEFKEQKHSDSKIPPELAGVPRELWSTSGDEVGLLKSAEPVVIKTKGGTTPSIRQYPIINEAIPSIEKQIVHFLEKGILRECRSPYNTPILPVSRHRIDKDGDPEYRFVQDLQVVNECVIAPRPVVPDPSLILTQIPVWAQYFTVLNLTGAFFSIPIAEESQPIFAFTWQGKQLTWTRLPQGFTSSPTIFSQILKNYLQDLVFPRKSVLVQYVDDLLLASKTENDGIRDTEYLCIQLVKKGHRASPSKLHHFTAAILIQIYNSLGIFNKLHTPH
uniref:ribonuclease H n=1 Tax=Aquila chrysaetos chrysaetos TaxID=223781 RepID=A0A663E1S1_AQUCH